MFEGISLSTQYFKFLLPQIMQHIKNFRLIKQNAIRPEKHITTKNYLKNNFKYDINMFVANLPYISVYKSIRI